MFNRLFDRKRNQQKFLEVKKVAEQGGGAAQLALGYLYWVGKGGGQDHAEAMR
jgi:TPR repeat protein